MTNEERARRWIEDRDLGRATVESDAMSLAMQFDKVRAEALLVAAAVCTRRSDELAARPQGPNWQSVEFTTAANEIRRLAEP